MTHYPMSFDHILLTLCSSFRFSLLFFFFPYKTLQCSSVSSLVLELLHLFCYLALKHIEHWDQPVTLYIDARPREVFGKGLRSHSRQKQRKKKKKQKKKVERGNQAITSTVMVVSSVPQKREFSATERMDIHELSLLQRSTWSRQFPRMLCRLLKEWREDI